MGKTKIETPMTASWAVHSTDTVSASYAITASALVGGTESSSFSTTASYALSYDEQVSCSYAETSSYSYGVVDDVEVVGTSFSSEFNNGNSGTSETIDWNNGQFQKSVLTGNVTYTFTDPAGPTILILQLVQDSGGTNTVTWPSSVKWSGGTAPVITSAGGAIDLVSFYYSASTYLGGITQDYQ